MNLTPFPSILVSSQLEKVLKSGESDEHSMMFEKISCYLINLVE